MADNFNEQTKAFLAWFLSHPGAYFSDKVALEDFRSRDAGRGLAAKSDIKKGEVLFRVPRNIVLSQRTSELSTVAPHVLENLVDWNVLVVVLLYEYLQGDKSPWKAYFDILPSNFDTLMYWHRQELEWLKESAVVGKIGKEDAETDFRETIVPLVQQHNDLFNFPPDSLGIDKVGRTLLKDDIITLCHRMASLIQSYSFDISYGEDDRKTGMEQDVEMEFWEEDAEPASSASGESDAEATFKGMVPMADMLNADAAKNNARLIFDDSGLEMTTTKHIKKGQEIFNDYGDLPQSELLRCYGYVAASHAEYDVAEIKAQVFVDKMLERRLLDETDKQERLEYLEAKGILEDYYLFRKQRSCFSEDDDMSELLILLNILNMSRNEFLTAKTQFDARLGALKEDRGTPPPIRAYSNGAKDAIIETILNVLQDFYNKAVSGLSSSERVDNDKAGGKITRTETQSDRRKRMADAVMRAEADIAQSWIVAFKALSD